MLNERVQKSINVLSCLSDLEFAVTGSYAKHVLGEGNSRSHFGEDSDVDIAVSELDLEEAYEELMNSGCMKGYECFGYDGWPPPPTHRGYKLEIFGGLPIHLVSTLKSTQRNQFVNIDGVNYLSPDYFLGL